MLVHTGSASTILPSPDPLHPTEPQWTCNSCGEAWSNDFVASLETKWDFAVTQAVARIRSTPDTHLLVQELEQLLSHGTQSSSAGICFSSSHYLMMKVKSHLISLYGVLASESAGGDLVLFRSLHEKRVELCTGKKQALFLVHFGTWVWEEDMCITSKICLKFFPKKLPLLGQFSIFGSKHMSSSLSLVAPFLL